MCETFHAALATQPDVLSIPPLTGPKWYACYTRGHHEKRVATTLRDHQIESFLPTHSQERRWSDRIKKIASPLFPSYVFARFRLRELPRVLDVAGVVTVVRAGVTPVTIPDEEIENVRRFAEAADLHGIVPTIEPFVEVGERVRIDAGPLRGVVGVVLEWRRGRTRVLIGLQAVGQGLSVNVDTASLRRIEG